jgi:hypothetical protein
MFCFHLRSQDAPARHQNYEQILPYSGFVVKDAPATNQENFKLDKAYPCDKMSLGHHLFLFTPAYPHQAYILI